MKQSEWGRRVRRLVFPCALLLCPALVLADEPGIVQLERFVAAEGGVEGRFEQQVTSMSGRKPQVSSGRFVFSRPGKFRWEYEKPYPQLLVSDGDRLWSWDPDLNQVTVQALGDALGATPAAILAGDGQLERNFVLIAEGDADGLAWVRAEPRQADSPFVLVRIGFADGMLRRMEMQDQFGQTTLIDFPDLVTGTRPDPTMFDFVPPPGADVLGG